VFKCYTSTPAPAMSLPLCSYNSVLRCAGYAKAEIAALKAGSGLEVESPGK
jgi:hypothetical protein